MDSGLRPLAGAVRPLVQRFIPTVAGRKTFWRTVLGGRVAAYVHADRDGTAYLALLSELSRVARHDRAPSTRQDA